MTVAPPECCGEERGLGGDLIEGCTVGAAARPFFKSITTSAVLGPILVSAMAAQLSPDAAVRSRPPPRNDSAKAGLAISSAGVPAIRTSPPPRT
jgi:hypothetical protein